MRKMGASWKKPSRVFDLPPDARNPEVYLQQLRTYIIEFRAIVTSESPSLRVCERRTEQFLQVKRQAQHIADIVYGVSSVKRRAFETAVDAWNQEWRQLLSIARAMRNTGEGVKGDMGELLLDPIAEEPLGGGTL